jgi:hypothetical protein
MRRNTSRTPCSGFSECGTERTTIADKQGWAPAADDTAEALGLKGHTLGWIPEDCVGEEDVPGDLDLDVTRVVVTNRDTSDAYAA